MTGDAPIRDAAWVARCVGRGAVAPLAAGDVAALADSLHPIELRAGQELFGGNAPSSTGVWIIRSGQVALNVVASRSRAVVGVLRPVTSRATSRCYSGWRCPTPPARSTA